MKHAIASRGPEPTNAAVGRALEVGLTKLAAISPAERLAMRPAHATAPRTSRDVERELPRSLRGGVPNEPVPARCANCRSLDHATDECELSGLDLDESVPRRQMEIAL